jgi:kumamolisin
MVAFLPHLHGSGLSDDQPLRPGSGPSASFLGSDMRAAYYGGTALTGTGQSVGLLEFYGTDLTDLNTYFTNANQTNNVPITLLSTDGTSTSCVDTKAGGNCDDTEQTLDMTQALGMAPGLSNLVMYVGSTDAAIFNAMATANPLNAQLSSSWTWTPADTSTDDPYFKEFAAQGQNLFQAAGDNAKWTTSGKASETYPADDAYVTTVGGTDLNTSSAGGLWTSETAWANSGGGISPHKIAIPSWQTAAAATCASCSQTYRNGPDVSANANYTYYVCADQTTCTANSYGGTSFAAPMWAGYLALVNQQSVANGNKTLGFINPSLYSIGAGSSYTTDFHDITSGSNGYSATTGYDLATGWGSPNRSGLINALAGSSSAAAMTSPVPGSTLTSASTTFTWSAGPNNVTGYDLWVGTVPGAANLASIGPQSGTSATVNLPTSGATIYVRLWTVINGGTYLYNDYTYTEFE